MKQRLLLILSVIIMISILDGSPIQEFSLPDVNNQNVNISDYIGQTLFVLDFWASWCSPCMLFMPELEKIHNEYDDVTVITINVDNPRSVNRAKSLLRSQRYSFVTLFDTNQDIMKRYQVTSIPHTFLVNLAGEIVYEHVGYTRGDETKLKAEIEKHRAQHIDNPSVMEEEIIEEPCE